MDLMHQVTVLADLLCTLWTSSDVALSSLYFASIIVAWTAKGFITWYPSNVKRIYSTKILGNGQVNCERVLSTLITMSWNSWFYVIPGNCYRQKGLQLRKPFFSSTAHLPAFQSYKPFYSECLQAFYKPFCSWGNIILSSFHLSSFVCHPTLLCLYGLLAKISCRGELI